ncbi:MAG: hypothetical protein H6558_03400 [Lewinellaceae bacterium]|nr:hypothetical protein [Lewinellaceae bacterium]MCB9289873.1 hypothetical protein [Lewinellaceae bacterium]
MKRSFLQLALASGLILCACSKDKAINPCAETIDIGKFGLLEASKGFLPYEGVNKIILKRETGDSLLLETRSFNTNFVPTTKELDCPEDGSFPAYYKYSSEWKDITLLNSTKNIKIEIELMTEPYFPEIDEATKIADVLTVAIEDPIREYVYYQLLSFYTAQREHPKPTISEEQFLGSVELNGQSFDYVYFEEKLFEVNGVMTNFQAYYTKNLGLIAFKDFEGHLWVFDRFE